MASLKVAACAPGRRWFRSRLHSGTQATSRPPPERVTRLRCAPQTTSCPHCGRRATRPRLLHRRVRSLAYRQAAWLDVTYAEYRGRCRKYFRTWPLDVSPKAHYDGAVRQAVLDRILLDGRNVERTRQAMRRDFLLELSEGCCAAWPDREGTASSGSGSCGF